MTILLNRIVDVTNLNYSEPDYIVPIERKAPVSLQDNLYIEPVQTGLKID